MKLAFIGLLIANMIWGLQTIFWKSLSHIDAITILHHRIMWGFVVMLFLMPFYGGWRKTFRHIWQTKSFGTAIANSVVMGGNWYIFVWAVLNNQIVNLVLGHFISPLFVIMIGCLFFKEKVTRTQIIAIFLVVVAIGYQLIVFGSLPILSLIVAGIFTLYVFLKKTSKLEPVEVIGIDTLFLVIPLLFIINCDQLTFIQPKFTDNLLLMIGGLITVAPMILYAIGARKCGLKYSGLLQYVSPSLGFLIGVFMYNEPFDLNKLIVFAIIWTGLLLCTIDSFRTPQKLKLSKNTKESKRDA